MSRKPGYPGPEHSARFTDPSVVKAYRYRPPYPSETFELLEDLMADPAGAVLDAGSGTGHVARPLAVRGHRVDAVDPSAGMIAAGRRLEGGDRVNWIEAPMEGAPLEPPYALVTAGQSLHWMDRDVVLPRFAASLLPGGRLAILSRVFDRTPWEEALADLVARYTTNPDCEPFDLVGELESRGIFRREGEAETATVPILQTVGKYVESFHSTSYLSRDRMEPEDAAAFDAAVERLVRDAHPGGRFTTGVRARVTWFLRRPEPA